MENKDNERRDLPLTSPTAVERLIDAILECGDCYSGLPCREQQQENLRRWCDFCRMRAAVDTVRALRAERDTALQENKAASDALDECAAPDPGKPLAQRIRDELHDFQTVIEEVSKVYCDLTRGRLSKPNTLASAVIGEVQEIQSQDIDEAIAEAVEEATDELRTQLKAALQERDNLSADYGALLKESNRFEEERDRLRAALEDARQRLIDGDLWPCAICGRLLSNHGSEPHGFEYELDEDAEEGQQTP